MSEKNKNILKYTVFGIIALIIISFIFKYRYNIKNINMDYIKGYILSYGSFSALCFVIIYGLKPIVFIVPASLLSILAGNIYGPYIALLLSMAGCFIAGSLAFFLAKILGKPFVDKILKGKALKLDKSIGKHGFILMLLMRLSIVFPYDALSYGGGLTSMKYWDFILGTMLGILPEMTVYSFMGDNLNKPLSAKFVIPIIVLVLIAITSYYAYKKYKLKAKD